MASPSPSSTLVPPPIDPNRPPTLKVGGKEFTFQNYQWSDGWIFLIIIIIFACIFI